MQMLAASPEQLATLPREVQDAVRAQDVARFQVGAARPQAGAARFWVAAAWPQAGHARAPRRVLLGG